MSEKLSQKHSKDSFVFYRSFFEALSDLPDQNQLELFKAISNFSLNFIEPELTGLSKTIFTLIQPQLIANKKKYENGCKGGEYGHLGGRPPKEKTLKKPLKNPKLTPNVNDNVNDNVNVSLVKKLFSILENKTNKSLSKNSIQSWSEEIRKLIEIDLKNRTNAIEDVERAIQAISDNFDNQYFPVIRSGSSLREKFDKIEAFLKRNNKTVPQDSFCQSLNKIIGKSIIKEIRDDGEKVRAIFNNANANDNWLDLEQSMRISIEDKIKAEFNKPVIFRF